MSAVVQATCPGCKQILRIPADWLNQPFRCKNCQTIIQARSAPAPVAPPPPVRPVAPPPAPRSTPLPASKLPSPIKAVPPSPVVAQPNKAPVAAPMAIPVSTPVGQVAPMAIPVSPKGAQAAPMAIPVAAAAPNLFDGIDVPSEGSTNRPRPRPRRGNWLPLAVGLLLLGTAGGAAFLYWPQLAPLFEKDKKGTTVAHNDDNKPTHSPSDDDNRDKGQSSKDRTETPKTTDKKPTDKKPTDKPTVATLPKPSDKTPYEKPSDNTRPKPSDSKPSDNKPSDNKPSDKKPEDPTKKPPVVNGPLPRRALVVSVHNYLFANPLTIGDPTPSGRNIQNLVGRLSSTRGFRVSANQVGFLSDAARPPRFQSVSPVKGAIENTVTNFLDSSRAQDRILLLFACHGVEIDGEVYLVPIEGDLTLAEGLIPLKWLYKKLEDCKAHQKILVLDICRINMARGEERPTFGQMTPKLDLALKNPPPGVQVWSSCIEGQQSYEFEDFRINNSVFLDCLYQVADRGVDGAVQMHDDLIPIEKIVEAVNVMMKKELAPLKLEQTSRLSGTIRPGGAPYNPDEKSAPDPEIVKGEAKAVADSKIVRAIIKEVSVPPLKKQQSEGLLRYEALPPFAADVLDKYPVDNTPNKLRDAVEKAQATLWAISPNEPPAELAEAVRKIKTSGELKGDLSSLKESYRAPGANMQQENAFKNGIITDQRQVASILRLLEDELKELTDAAEMKKDAPKRWQVAYDFMLARLQQQIAYVYEYSSMLGSMRKEFPPRDPAVNSGWRLASRKKLQGDGTGRKLLRDAEKLLEKLIEEHKGTPWEVLARREKFTALGLEWKPN